MILPVTLMTIKMIMTFYTKEKKRVREKFLFYLFFIFLRDDAKLIFW